MLELPSAHTQHTSTFKHSAIRWRSAACTLIRNQRRNIAAAAFFPFYSALPLPNEQNFHSIKYIYKTKLNIFNVDSMYTEREKECVHIGVGTLEGMYPATHIYIIPLCVSLYVIFLLFAVVSSSAQMSHRRWLPLLLLWRARSLWLILQLELEKHNIGRKKAAKVRTTSSRTKWFIPFSRHTKLLCVPVGLNRFMVMCLAVLGSRLHSVCVRVCVYVIFQTQSHFTLMPEYEYRQTVHTYSSVLPVCI